MSELTNVTESELKILTQILMFLKTIEPYDVCEIKLDHLEKHRVKVMVRRNKLEVFDI